MYVDWTRHLSDPKEKESFEQSILGAKRVLERLKALIDERQFSMESIEKGLKQFDNPNWAYKQAFNNGLKSAYETIKKLIDLDNQVVKETN